MPKLLHGIRIKKGEHIPAGTKIECVSPAPKAGHREQVTVKLPDGRVVDVDASAVDAHSF